MIGTDGRRVSRLQREGGRLGVVVVVERDGVVEREEKGCCSGRLASVYYSIAGSPQCNYSEDKKLTDGWDGGEF